MSLQHFKFLNKIRKKEGWKEALKYDRIAFSARSRLFQGDLDVDFAELVRMNARGEEPMMYVDSPIIDGTNFDPYNIELMNAVEAVRSGLYTPSEAWYRSHNKESLKLENDGKRTVGELERIGDLLKDATADERDSLMKRQGELVREYDEHMLKVRKLLEQ